MGKKKKKVAAKINGIASSDAMGSVEGLPKHLVGPVQIASATMEMSSDEARLRWLFDFANRDDLLELAPEELSEQYAHVFAFAAKGQTFSSDILSSDGAADHLGIARAFLFEIRQAVRSGLRQAIKLDSQELGFVGWETQLDGLKRRVRRGRSAYQGALRTTFLAAVADAIADDHEKRFEICEKHSCQRFFWKVGGAKYCSKSCGSAVRQKRWRNTEEVAK